MNKNLVLLFVSSIAFADKMEYSPERIDQAKQLVAKYSVEFGHMATEKMAVSAEGTNQLDDGNWGALLNGNKKHSEFARSLQATLLLQATKNSNIEEGYKSFTEGQNNKITLEQFRVLHGMVAEFAEKTNNSDVLEAMIVINDIGKAESIQKKVAVWAKNETVDHDQTLIDLLTEAETNSEAAALIPAIMKLDAADRELMRKIWSSRLSIAQFSQGECPEKALEKFVQLSSIEKLGATLETIFDVAGARAHVGQKCNMPSFLLPTFLTAYDKLKQDFHVHEMFATFYFELVEKTGATFDGSWSEEKKIALGRLFRLGRGSTKEYFEKVVKAFEALPEDTQNYLIKELSLKASDLATGITIMYSPAFVVKANKDHQDLVHAYTCLSQYYNHARYKQLPKIYIFDINDAAKPTVALNLLVNHPIYVEKHGDDSSKLLLEKPVKEHKTILSHIAINAGEKFSWFKEKVKGKC